MSFQLIAQLVGFVAVGFSLLVYQVNKRPLMLKLLMSASILYTIHFFLLGAFTGAVMNFLGAARIYAFSRHPNQQSVRLLLLFILLFIIGTALTWDGYTSLLPLGGMIAGSFAFWQLDTKLIRLFSLIAPPLWLVYNFISGSYPGMLIEVFNIASVLVGMYRFDARKPVLNK